MGKNSLMDMVHTHRVRGGRESCQDHVHLLMNVQMDGHILTTGHINDGQTYFCFSRANNDQTKDCSLLGSKFST